MAKRLAIAAMVVILAAVLIRSMVSEEPADVPQASSADSPPSAWTNSVSSDATNAPSPSSGIPQVGEENGGASEPTSTKQPRLRALEQAALAGDADAQFRLSNAMRHCVNVLAYSDEATETTEDPLRRAYLFESREECQYFADRRDRLVDDAFEWERRSLDAGAPTAQANAIVTQIGNGELQVDQAEDRLKALLASNDPFVFGAIATVSLWNGVTAESAAWHMLACEDSGPPELCSIMNESIATACTGSARCGANHDVEIARYYMNAHPALFDVARGRYQALKDQLQQGRASEIDLTLAIQPSARE